MGHDKLRKFAENETFSCLLQPSSRELLAEGYFNLKDHPVKGNWSGFLGHDGPVVLELGCGKGEYTIDLARRDAGRNYIGVDIKGARLWKGAKYAMENKLGNVGFLRTRIEFITAFFAPGEVEEIWLTFSDPQLKSPNSRLTSPVFLERYRKFLKSGGVVHLKTDSRFLHEYTKAVCRVNGLEIVACTADLYGHNSAEGGAAGGCPPEAGAVGSAGGSVGIAVGAVGGAAEGGGACAGVGGTAEGACPPGAVGAGAVGSAGGSVGSAAGAVGGAAEGGAVGAGAVGAVGSAGGGGACAGVGSAAGGIVPAVRDGNTFEGLSPDSLDPVVREVKTFYEQMSLKQGFDITYLSFRLDSGKPLRSPEDPSEFDSKLWRSLESPRHFFGL
ncbi:MAG: tRNA (guanosine(46)-N7)-methyltransferase TrmB [Bacteroidales bacterium]|nr:tRNA (guanosine(46)-N7)-methyltransferase TrmB [Bacteroidales bacterium]